MKHIGLLIFVLIFSCTTKKEKKIISSVDNKTPKRAELKSNDALSFKVYDYDGLKPLLNINDNKVHVVNFWATWCAPCVKELPYFEALHSAYTSDELEILLVSLDFPRQYTSKLEPFLEKYQLKSKVAALDDVNQNRWISAIDDNWDGAIPATLIYRGNKREFYEGSFTKEELQTVIQKFINKP